MKIFSVKTLYSWRIAGRKQPIMIEERLVLFRAKNSLDALARAKQEAKKYCEYSFKNQQGKAVKTKFLGFADAFELEGALGSGSEIYSSTQVSKRNISAMQIIEKRAGKKLSLSTEKKLRKLFQSR